VEPRTKRKKNDMFIKGVWFGRGPVRRKREEVKRR
jgi:hypothetical protein